MAKPELVVIFTARERFSVAAQALERLYASDATPFRLIVVDAGTPERYRREMAAVLKGRENVEIVKSEGYLLPNQARNVAIGRTDEDYLLFIENDNLARPGFIQSLLTAAKETHGGVAVPWLWEKADRHHDTRCEIVEEAPDGSLRILPGKQMTRPPESRTPIVFFEHHCFLMTRAALTAHGPFDEALNSREFIDTCLAVRKAKVPVVLEPRAQADFCAPPPVYPDERTFYRLHWDMKGVKASAERIARRWNIQGIPDSYDFAREQMLRQSHITWSWVRAKSLLSRIRNAILGR